MQRKPKLVVLLIAGIVGFVGLVVLTLVPSEPMKVSLQSYANGLAVISIKNRTSHSINYVAAKVEQRIDGTWSESGLDALNLEFPVMGPGQQTNLTMAVSSHAPWRISVAWYRPVNTNSMRFRTGTWCKEHGLIRLGYKLLEAEVGHSFRVSTPEMAP
jgi:hypothetical protein